MREIILLNIAVALYVISNRLGEIVKLLEKLTQ